ncbi:ribonucleotide-diphosphate reductase [Fischerella thermalis CCMEE 5330]|uniref:R2-like ligand binding oxidase n=1 Tax=Fischerella thermalis CCMEE 5330 TaxID=2019670 RepID=A0A2N6MNI5_9CYAN|nr:ribonucleotide-diphosphate reductase [Fischerella thermalis CCMEE 5330]
MNRTQAHDSFVTTTRGLDRSLPPMKLFEKAKRYGIWNPSDIDFKQDQQDWQRLTHEEREVILHLTSLFVAGEEAVTLDLLPLMMTVAKEGRIEEEMFLTTFLWEEAKHTDFFQRFLNEVLQVNGDALTRFHGAAYRTIFYEALPRALDRLMVDQSPEAQLEASITYNMIVEGTLAETGYHAYFTMLKNNGLMPGNTEGIQKLKQDESRHIAYGIFLISRIISEHPHLWDFAQAKMQELLMPALGVIDDIFSAYDPVPFGLKQDDFVSYAMMQFQKRLSRIEAARNHSLHEIYRVTHAAIDAEDA